MHQPQGLRVIKLIQVAEWKTHPLWTHNMLQALITDKDKQMSGYHRQHACFHYKCREINTFHFDKVINLNVFHKPLV